MKMLSLDRTRLRPGSFEIAGDPRPTLGARTKSEQGHPTTRSASTATRPSYRRILSDNPPERSTMRALTLSEISRWGHNAPMQSALVIPPGSENPTPKTPTQPHYVLCVSPSHVRSLPSLPPALPDILATDILSTALPADTEPQVLPVPAPRALLPRSLSMPVNVSTAKIRVAIPMPDAATWFSGEARERVQLPLRPLPSTRNLGRARVADTGGRTLVVSNMNQYDAPGDQRAVSRLFTQGLTRQATLVMRHEGVLRRVNYQGLVVPMPDGLYSIAIDQSSRFLASLTANPNSTAERSAEGGLGEGAYGSHGELLVRLPGFFFGEFQVVAQQAVAWNNRSSIYMTPAELSAQVADHDVLTGAAYFPVQGGP